MVRILVFSAPVRFRGHFEEMGIAKVLLNTKPRRVEKFPGCRFSDVREKQEGWLSPTERASVSAISLRHIIWLPYITRVTPVCRCACKHLATSRESKAHFWVRPWDNRDKFYMDGKRIQCLSNASLHVPIYLQSFPSN